MPGTANTRGKKGNSLPSWNLHSNREPDNKYMIFTCYIYYIHISVISDSVMFWN